MGIWAIWGRRIGEPARTPDVILDPLKQALEMLNSAGSYGTLPDPALKAPKQTENH